MSDDSDIPWAPYKAGDTPGGGLPCPGEGLVCGINCLDIPGVPVVESELSDLRLSSRLPPLPEVTVICGGRPGCNEPPEGIVLAKEEHRA